MKGEAVAEALLTAARRVLPFLPLKVTQRFGRMLGSAVYATRPDMRAIVCHNLSCLLEQPSTAPMVQRAARGAFQTLLLNYVDMIHTSRFSPTEMFKATEAVGFERLVEAQAGGRGVVIATAHLGSIDQGGQALVVRGARCAVLTEHITPEWLFRFFVQERQRFGGKVITLDEAVVPHIQQALREGYAVGVACDWDLQGTGIPVTVPPLRHALRIPLGISLLALRQQCPIVPIWAERLSDGRTRVSVKEPFIPEATVSARSAIRQSSERIAYQLIAELRRRPHQWVLFHRVWEDDP
ncbi:MAG: lysophospholipid acyltransferase family protein [Chloroflexi bacterium]|nr:lysophospholipid acyltransferase family protein [Chloroflexota bacterium]